MPALLSTARIQDRLGNRYLFISLKGHLNPSGQLVQDITRPGIDGVAFRLQGLRNEPQEMISIEPLSSILVKTTRMDRYRALQGKPVRVTDDFDQDFNAVVLRADFSDLKPLIKSVGGLVTNPAAFLYVKWTLYVTD